MPPFLREKLIRHRIPELIAAKGETCETRIADPTELLGLLTKKLIEEAYEIDHAFLFRVTDKKALLAELADVMEVVRCLREILGPDEVDEVVQERRFDRGSLSHRVVLNLDSIVERKT